MLPPGVGGGVELLGRQTHLRRAEPARVELLRAIVADTLSCQVNPAGDPATDTQRARSNQCMSAKGAPVRRDIFVNVVSGLWRSWDSGESEKLVFGKFDFGVAVWESAYACGGPNGSTTSITPRAWPDDLMCPTTARQFRRAISQGGFACLTLRLPQLGRRSRVGPR
jgi:hypothetical protein